MNTFSRKKKLLYTCILLVLCLLVVEVGANAVYVLLKHQIFPFGSYEDNIRDLTEPRQSPEPDGHLVTGGLGGHNHIKVIHPYLGYVRDPDRTANTSYMGFPEKDDDPLVRNQSDSIRVAVFGGSFAEGTSVVGAPAIRSALGDQGINAEVLTFAMGGYKQPQQLLALGYLLSHGAEIDVAVNIDGFNEVALPLADNIPRGVNPFYPRAWYGLTFELDDQVALRQIGRISVIEDDRRKWANLFRHMPRFSIIRNIGWRVYDKVLVRRIVDLNNQIRQSKPNKPGRFLTQGPDLGIVEESVLFEKIVDHWKTCSLMMKALCDSQGIVYVHALQPNQYFEAGRTLTSEERKIAFREDHPYRQGVIEGYPRLLAAKSDLIDRGVNFHDLTMIFKGIPRVIYQDDCCHPNKFGHEIIARHIAEAIAEELTLRQTE